MRRLTSLNVGFVGVLSCLVLVLALFFSTGVASAHGAQAAHSQTSVTSLSTLTDDQGCYQVYVPPGRSYYGRYYASGRYVTVCGNYGYYGGYYGGYSGCRKVYVQKGYRHGVRYGRSGYVTVCGPSGYYGTCRIVYVPGGFYRDVYYQYGQYVTVCR
jgi:hypothetical protein